MAVQTYAYFDVMKRSILKSSELQSLFVEIRRVGLFCKNFTDEIPNRGGIGKEIGGGAGMDDDRSIQSGIESGVHSGGSDG